MLVQRENTDFHRYYLFQYGLLSRHLAFRSWEAFAVHFEIDFVLDFATNVYQVL